MIKNQSMQLNQHRLTYYYLRLEIVQVLTHVPSPF